MNTIPAKENYVAFMHLQRGFDLIRSRNFSKAQAESRCYKKLIDYDNLPLTDNRTEKNPKVSVVIVAFNINMSLIECLDSIATSNNPPHEIIIVDNGGNESIHEELSRRSILHINVGFNTILAEGRNIGVHFARAPIVAFIDDDAIAGPDYVASVAEAFISLNIHGFRGKVLPKSNHPNNNKQNHYDLGALAIPRDIDTEGNSAFCVNTWRRFEGQDPLLFGLEGVELSYRMAKELGDYCLAYWPITTIRHDYSISDSKLESKTSRHMLMREYLTFKHPDWRNYHSRLETFCLCDEQKENGNNLLQWKIENHESTETVFGIEGPLISICVPTYNSEKYIKASLRSALKQIYRNFEVVVVDDGSTDNTADVVKKMEDPRIRYIEKEHSGTPKTRNRCIEEARGKFIIWLDSDDIILPHTLKTYIELLSIFPGTEVFYGHLVLANENLVREGIMDYMDYRNRYDELLSELVIQNTLPNPFTMIRKTVFERIGCYNTNFARAHDYEFWARFAATGRAKGVHCEVGIYRKRKNSLSLYGGKVNTAYEAAVVKSIIQNYTLNKLFPCFSNTRNSGESNLKSQSFAWMLAAFVMVRYGDLNTALEYFNRSVKCTDFKIIKRLSEMIEMVAGVKADFGREADRNQFDELMENGLHYYVSNQLQNCVDSSSKLNELKPNSLESSLFGLLILQRWGESEQATHALFILRNLLLKLYNNISDLRSVVLSTRMLRCAQGTS